MRTQLVGPKLPGLRFIEHIGSGGFADVFLYQREEMNLKVAVKLLRADVLSQAERQQFQDEANTMADLADHPYIVTVFSAGTSDDNRPYLVMKYYAGSNLEVQVADEQLSVPEALRIGIYLAGAVETAHRAGIIHRDIKPANILRDQYGQPALTDFGIAGRADREGTDDDVGLSLPWSPPEIISGVSSGSATSDVYSLAATIWQLLVGRTPFEERGGDNSERAMLSRILHAKRPATGRADVPSSLDKLLQQAMAKEVDHRPRSAEELGRHLQRVEHEMRLDRTEIPLPIIQPTRKAPAPPQAIPMPAPEPIHRTPAVAAEPGDLTMLKGPARPRPKDSGIARAEPENLAPSTRQASPAVADLTISRDQLATSQDAETAGPAELGQQPRKASGSPRWAVGAVIGLVVTSVAIAAGLMLSGTDETPAGSLPKSSAPTALEDVVDGFTPVIAPTLTAKLSRRDTAVFKATPEESKDEFQWQVRMPGGDFTAFPAPATLRTIRVEARRGGEVCARLMVRRDGQISDPVDACVRVP